MAREYYKKCNKVQDHSYLTYYMQQQSLQQELCLLQYSFRAVRILCDLYGTISLEGITMDLRNHIV